MSFLVVPLDARPVCYQQVGQVAAIAGLNLQLPPAELLGQLKEPADLQQLDNWLAVVLKHQPTQALVLSWDMLLYGGLIPSRLHHHTLAQLQQRLNQQISVFEGMHATGFSAVMRIPNYNNCQEEPDYWEQYGQALYNGSWQQHQEQWPKEKAYTTVPESVVNDFLSRRHVNHQMNLNLLQAAIDNHLAYHVFAQDDTGAFGLNVQEAQTLMAEIDFKAANAHVQTGADEVALVLMARQLLTGQTVKVAVQAFPEQGLEALAKFDGVALGQVVERQIVACGGTYCTSVDEADVVVLVNAIDGVMGDHMETPDLDALLAQPKAHHLQLIKTAESLLPHKPVILIDAAYANGADSALINGLLQASFPLLGLAAYAGWNTPGNTVGSAVAAGLITYYAKQQHTFKAQSHHQWLLTRFMDDWAYQAVVRAKLRAANLTPTEQERALTTVMAEPAALLKQYFNEAGIAPLGYKLPCQRLFEVEVCWE